ncbi:MAG: lytic murein transglycosylase [Solirubrobacterales bacterium]
MGRRSASLAVVATAGALALAGLGACGDDAASNVRAKLPTAPQSLADGIGAADAAWREAIDDWRASGHPRVLPEELALPGRYIQRAAAKLAGRPGLARRTLRRLPRRLARQVRDMARAKRNLRRLSAGWPPHEIRSGPPTHIEVLMPAYRTAKRRFGVHFRILAAVNHVESAFGRARNDSVAGARGPMQFIPSTWAQYGMGGNIHDPRDAILGAANYLDQSGAPGDYRAALHAYNPSGLYVDTVLRYARLIGRDRDSFYLLYSWPIRAH